MAMFKHIAGVGPVEMTPQEEAAWLAESEANDPANLPEAAVPLALQQIACARLTVDGWDVTGIERSTGLSVAFVADTDTVWAFFNEPQPDTYYVVMPSDGVTKHEDCLEITLPGLASVNLVVSRVQ